MMPERKVWSTEDPFTAYGPFRANVEEFVDFFGSAIDLKQSNVTAHRIEVTDGESPSTTTLLVCRENAALEPPVCDQCRIIGWQHQPVATKRYHFIIPCASSTAPLADYLQLNRASTDEASKDQYATSSVFESSAHLLHGILHANGHGHLMRINGLEGGSAHLSGRRITNIWDKLCQRLRARKVSVEDVSNKAGMELRVLYAIAHRHTWYGRWGYEHGRGAFNISKATWRATLNNVHNIPVAAVLADFLTHTSDGAVPEIIDRYQVSYPGEPDPTTLGTLLKRMLFLLSDAQAAAAVLGVDIHHPGLLRAEAARGAKPREQAAAARPSQEAVKGAVRPAEALEVPEAAKGVESGVGAVPSPAPANASKPQEQDGQAGSVGGWQVSEQADPRPKKKQKVQKSEGRKEGSTLRVVPQTMKPADLEAVSMRFTPEIVHDIAERVIAALKKTMDQWVKRTVLKSMVTQKGESPAVDACLKVLGNTQYGSWAIHRQLDPSSKASFYLVQPAAGTREEPVTAAGSLPQDVPALPSTTVLEESSTQAPSAITASQVVPGDRPDAANASLSGAEPIEAPLDLPNGNTEISEGRSGAEQATLPAGDEGGSPLYEATSHSTHTGLPPSLQEKEQGAYTAEGSISSAVQEAGSPPLVGLAQDTAAEQRGDALAQQPEPAEEGSPGQEAEEAKAQGGCDAADPSAAQGSDTESGKLPSRESKSQQDKGGSGAAAMETPEKEGESKAANSPRLLREEAAAAAPEVGHSLDDPATAAPAGSEAPLRDAEGSLGVAALDAGETDREAPLREAGAESPRAFPRLTSAMKGKRSRRKMRASQPPWPGAGIVREVASAEAPLPDPAIFGQAANGEAHSPAGSWGSRAHRSARVGASPQQAQGKPVWGSHLLPATSKAAGKAGTRSGSSLDKQQATTQNGHGADSKDGLRQPLETVAQSDAGREEGRAGAANSEKERAADKPLQALMETVAKVGISPAAGLLPSSEPQQPRRPPRNLQSTSGGQVCSTAGALESDTAVSAPLMPGDTAGAAEAGAAGAGGEAKAGVKRLAAPLLPVASPKVEAGPQVASVLGRKRRSCASQPGPSPALSRRESKPRARPAPTVEALPQPSCPPTSHMPAAPVGVKQEVELANGGGHGVASPILNLAPLDVKSPAVGGWASGKKKAGSTGKKKKARKSLKASVGGVRSGQAVPAQRRSNLGLPAKKPWQLLKPGAAYSQQAGFVPRDQVTCDLVYFFDRVMRCYTPALATGTVPEALAPAPDKVDVPISPNLAEAAQPNKRSSRKGVSLLKADKLVEQVAVLRDTKHFVKDYNGNAIGPGSTPDGSMRLLCRLKPMDFLSAGESSGLVGPGKTDTNAPTVKKAKVKIPKRRRVVHPPAELVLLPTGISLKKLLLAVEEVYRSTYRMFSDLQVTSIEGLASTKPSSRIYRLQQGCVLQVDGVNASTDPAWHHAGGEEDWQVSCTCGCRDDDGERMIACDSCGLWMHLRCQGFPDSLQNPPEEFVCKKCSAKPPAQPKAVL